MPKIGADDLTKAIGETLTAYGKQADEVLQEELPAVLKDAVKTLKKTSPKKTGDYSKGWTYKVKNNRLGVQGVIYNKKEGSITHLLENGHLTRNGKRTEPQKHIAPVNEEVQTEIVKRIKESLAR